MTKDVVARAEFHREFSQCVMPVLCERTRKVLGEYGVKTPDNCNGSSIVCGHCQHTARLIGDAILQTRHGG